MFSLILFWTLQTAPASSTQFPAQALNDSITIFGTCWDISTGVDLQTSVFAIVKGKKLNIGKSNDEGKFDLQIPTSTENLTFEMNGYRPTSLPVNILGKTKKSDRFAVSIRMISLDSQHIAKPYQQTLQPEATAETRSIKTATGAYFIIKDAYSGKSVKAKVCLSYTKTGRTKCIETDTTKLPVPVNLEKASRISLHVSADGFRNYDTDINTSDIGSGEVLYQIKLLRVQNPVSFYFDGPDSLNLRYIFGDRDRYFTEFAFEKGTHQKNMNFDVINQAANFLGTYQVVVMTGLRERILGDDRRLSVQIDRARSAGNSVLLEDRFTAIPGLNFKAIHVDGPSPATMASDALKSSNYAAIPFEKRTLYFDQSSYLMRRETKLTLDSISEFLRNQRNAKAHVTGHTDNVGKRNLNVILSEYRARVVAHYLQEKGVQSQQIVFNWKGPDTPVAANDSDSNMVKNRRVEVRVSGN